MFPNILLTACLKSYEHCGKYSIISKSNPCVRAEEYFSIGVQMNMTKIVHNKILGINQALSLC
jgi:hypothetical protein